MTDVNKLVIYGGITRNVSEDERAFSYLQNGSAVLKFSIANNQSKKKSDGTWEDIPSYFDVTYFGKGAENIKQYLVKGQKVLIEGHLKQDRWQDQSGNNCSKVYIVADYVQLVGAKKADDGFSANKTYSNAKEARQASEQAQSYQSDNGSDFPEDIPF